MADDVDRANQQQQEMNDDALGAAMRQAAKIPTGEPGICEYCGEYFARTVRGACGRCRDKYKLE